MPRPCRTKATRGLTRTHVATVAKRLACFNVDKAQIYPKSFTPSRQAHLQQDRRTARAVSAMDRHTACAFLMVDAVGIQ